MSRNGFINKFIYSVSANLIGLAVSVVTTLLIPRFLGIAVEQYGYLQLYLFYTSYVGFMHFGWVDGILLREGGKSYCTLDKALYSKQYKCFTIFELIVAVTIITVSHFAIEDVDKHFVVFFTAINIVVMLMRAFLQYVLQATNRIKAYSITASIGRILYFLLCIAIMLFGTRTYKLFVIADTLCKFLSLLITMWFCRDIVFCKEMPSSNMIVINEIKENITVGIKLVFANIASMLITGVVRQGIENKWDIATFGKVSLTLSLSNFFITFISAVAIVLFPTLRNVEKEKLSDIYQKLCNSLSIVVFGLISLYYPLKTILSMWLPQYSDGLMYMAILFPMCFYLSKVTLVIQTYFQVLRLENKLMKINLTSLAVAIITTLIAITLLNNLTLAVASILINQAFRCILAEFCLSSSINVKVGKEIIIESILVISFVVSNWILSGWVGFIVYLAIYLVFLFAHRNSEAVLLSGAKTIIKKRR